jgi:triosephosphate isomerase
MPEASTPTHAMRQKIVAGNWKMHGSRAENAALVEAIVARVADERVGCLVLPPFVYLHEIARLLRGSPVRLGAQDLSAEAGGAFTGDVSGAMLRDVGCTHVLVGHSERRSIHAEANSLVARKFAAAQARGLVPVLCVGESLAERESGRTFEVVAAQLDAILTLSGVGTLATAVLAYEPVWAIGTGRTATPEQAQEVHAFLRQRVAAGDAKIAGEIRILYGGSVKGANARDIFAMPDVDGGLVGGASLKAEEFLAIVAAA